MEANLKNIKDILDETIVAERRCNDIMYSLLLKENKRFQSPILERIASSLNKLNNTPPVEVLKELETEYDKQNLG